MIIKDHLQLSIISKVWTSLNLGDGKGYKMLGGFAECSL